MTPAAAWGVGGIEGGGAEFERIFDTTDMLILGELHGSNEIPMFAFQAVEEALGVGPVVLGVEVWVSEQEAMDRYLASPAGEVDRAALLARPFWTHVNDGRASVAMLELVDGARRLINDGAALSVVCFDDRGNPGAQDRDHAMAAFLQSHREANTGSKYVVLCGSLHARTTIGHRWNAELKPMAWRLNQASRVVSLNARYSDGAFWACAPDCGVQHFGGRGDKDARGVTMHDQRDEVGYDGVFDVGATTASIPAVKVAEAKSKGKVRFP